MTLDVIPLTLYLFLEPQMPTLLRYIICTSNLKPTSTKHNQKTAFPVPSGLLIP